MQVRRAAYLGFLFKLVGGPDMRSNSLRVTLGIQEASMAMHACC